MSKTLRGLLMDIRWATTNEVTGAYLGTDSTEKSRDRINATIDDAEHAIREAIERARPSHQASPIAVGFPQSHADFAFISGADAFEANLLRELGIDNDPQSGEQ